MTARLEAAVVESEMGSSFLLFHSISFSVDLVPCLLLFCKEEWLFVVEVRP